MHAFVLCKWHTLYSSYMNLRTQNQHVHLVDVNRRFLGNLTVSCNLYTSARAFPQEVKLKDGSNKGETTVGIWYHNLDQDLKIKDTWFLRQMTTDEGKEKVNLMHSCCFVLFCPM